jgi:putative serine protease PepD
MSSFATTPSRPRSRVLVAVLLGPVLATILLAGCSSGASGDIPQASAEPRASGTAPAGEVGASPGAVTVQQDFVSVIKQVLPSVVEIRTNAGLGSGVVLDQDGDIVTNAHVVADASSFQVLASSAATGTVPFAAAPAPLRAVLVGSCPGDDLAVISVGAAAELRPARFGDVADVEVGDLVLAIGSPLGLGGTVTDGIVSTIGRSVAEPASAGTPAAVLTDTIQTSAAINPGNSGGALVSIGGTVIGIPTLAGVNRSGGTAAGIGFAIPASIAVNVGHRLAATEGAKPGSMPSGCHS